MSKLAKRNDPVFGEMTYNHAWYKYEDINWWGLKTKNVKVTAHGYSGETISKHQQTSYLHYEKTIDDVIRKVIPDIVTYLKKHHGVVYTNKNVVEALSPVNVLFLKDGNWGILFDSVDDPEHGLAVYTEGKTFNVGPQDNFL